MVGQECLAFEEGLEGVVSQLDESKGAIFSSGYDYPGRHSRWDIGFYDPALELVAGVNDFRITALNEQGKVLLELFERILKGKPFLSSLVLDKGGLLAEIARSSKIFSEEERSNQPSIFSVLREITAAFNFPDISSAHFGLYGAFAYDLIQEFESLELVQERPVDAKRCHLYLPLEVIVIDRRKEISRKFSYDIETPSGYTSKFSCEGKSFSFPAASGSEEIECDHKPG